MFSLAAFSQLAVFASLVLADQYQTSPSPGSTPGFCLDVAGGGTADGTAVQIYSCNGTPAQNWTWTGPNTTPGALQLVGTGKCLDVINGDTNSGAQLQIWDCTGGPNQQFDVRAVDHVDRALVWLGAPSGTCRAITVPGGAYANGTRVDLEDCEVTGQNANQQFVVGAQTTTPPPPSAGTIAPTNGNGLCLDVAGGSQTNGAAVQIYTCNSTPAQAWKVSGSAIQVYGGSKCLDVVNGANTDGTKLQIWDCTGGPNQQFQYVSNQVIQWVGMNKCLDVTNGAFQAGTPVQIWDCTFGPDQLWTIS